MQYFYKYCFTYLVLLLKGGGGQGLNGTNAVKHDESYLSLLPNINYMMLLNLDNSAFLKTE